MSPPGSDSGLASRQAARGVHGASQNARVNRAVRSSAMPTVAYPGPEGTHSASACDKLFPDAELVVLPTFEAVAEAVAQADVDCGLLPIENTFAGPVRASPVEEIRGAGPLRLELDQGRELLAALPWATPIAAAPTSGAAAHVAEAG